jgi:hypothetical protein
VILQLDEERWRLVVKCLRFVNHQATNEVADTIEERLERDEEQQDDSPDIDPEGPEDDE